MLHYSSAIRFYTLMLNNGFHGYWCQNKLLVVCRWLGVTSAGVPEKLGCSNLPLSHRQKDLCQKKVFLLPSIRDGARLAITECQNQFRHERWNCSTSQNPSVFGHEANSGKSA